MKKVLITGGAGFIGYHLANNLLLSNYKVDLLDNFSRAVEDQQLMALEKNDRVNLINEDILNSEIANKLDSDYEFIYHLAAVIGVQHVLKSPFDVLVKNFLLLQNTLMIAEKQKKLKRFIFASTSEVYAGTLKYYGLEFPTIEKTPLTINELSEARSSYMLSKIYGEAMCLQSGLPITIVRPHNFYGPRMGLSHVVPELMKKTVESKTGSIDVFSPNHKRTFSYIKDAVNMIQLLAESELTIGKSYNIGDDKEELTIIELAQKIIDLIDNKININCLSTTPGSPERRIPSIKKVNQVITYVKKYPLEEGLKETFNWYDKYIFSGNEKSAI